MRRLSFPPASLGGRLLLGAAAFIVVVLLATALVIDLALHRFVQGQIDQRLDGQILSVAASLERGPDGALRLSRNVDAPPFDWPGSGWYWTVLDGPGSPHSRSLGSVGLTLPAQPDVWPPHPVAGDGRDPRGGALRVRMQRHAVGPLYVVIAATAPLAALEGPMREALTSMGLALLVLGGGLLLAVVLQVRLGLRPLAGLRAALADVRLGRRSRLPETQPSEVRPLVAEINSLLDANAAHLKRARGHVANLAHGLKTPLATLAMTLRDRQADPDGTLLALVGSMDRRIRHHLARARVAALSGPARARVELAPRLADLAGALAKLHADREISIARDVPSGLAAGCEGQDFDEMAGNLLDNACRWARREVWLAARADGPWVEIVIDDDGPGLPEERLREVLRPGLRLDESVPGHGFGLPIARELAELYGGTLALGERPGGGLRVTLRLPNGL